jgi:siderophore synthetase component
VSRPADVSPEHWRAAGRALVAKLLGELAYEEIVRPARDGDVDVVAFDGGVSYAFAARRGPFGAWRVDPASVRRREGGRDEPAEDPLRVALDARATLGTGGPELADLVSELTATHAADARLLRDAVTARELADLSHLDLEAHQTGHPCMILNKGRLGFSASDVERYAPEAGRDLRLAWVAVDPQLGRHHGVPREALLRAQLDDATRARFAAELHRRGGDPAAWTWLPVHPFHLDEAIALLFAAELATGRMVVLGEAPDRHRPLQSIRTLSNVDAPQRHDVKLPLMIRNTLVWRGLAPQATAAAPQVTAWLQRTAARDAFLTGACRMAVLGEVASVTVRHPQLAAVPDAPYRFHELLGAVWREPVAGLLRPGERARTMAALLAVGRDGRALVAELVARSGLEPETWLEHLLATLLPPLLHWLHRYGVAFCPHGENTVLLFDERDVPVGIAVKDLAEDVNLLPDPLPEYRDLPPDADAVLLRWPARELRHSILSAIFAGHFRFFGDVVERHLGVTESRFWELVADEVRRYQTRFPELAERFAAFDLLCPEFERVCLNREQLLGGGFHDRAERDEDFDLTLGKVANPIAALPCH